jgi:CSLREA domain-containing protein
MNRYTVLALGTLAIAACTDASAPRDNISPSFRLMAAAAGSFLVNSTVDAVDANPGDGVCASAAGECTLRAAINEANAHAGKDAISLPAGTYRLTIPGANEEDGFTGDLDIRDDLTIDGAGAANTTVDGNGAVVDDRVFHVLEAEAHFSSFTIIGGSGYVSGATGDGIFNDGGVVTLTNCVVSQNTGGGILNVGTMTLIGTTVSGNSSGGDGVGLYNRGMLTLDRSVVTGNVSTYAGGLGGGIFNEDTLTLTNSTVSDNTGGGIYNVPEGIVRIDNSTISGNASFRGAGVRNEGWLAMTNSTLSGNAASELAGGFFNNGGSVTVTNVTLSGNTGTGGVNGIWNAGGPVTLHNTLVSGSAAGVNCDGTVTDGGGSLSWPDATCPGLNADPKLGGLANNGGPTQTHALLPGSAAIDAAVAAYCPATDQRGVPRPQGPACDIGAFEVQVGPQAAVQSLITAVQDLAADGVLTPDQAGGLQDKLTAALSSLNDGRTKPACNLLAAFVNQVRGFVSARRMPSAVGQALINTAGGIRGQIAC